MLWTVWGGLWLIGTALPRGMVYTCFWLVLTVAAAVLGFVSDSENILPPLVLAVVSLGLLGEAVHGLNGRLLILSMISLGLGTWVWRTNAGWAGLNWAFFWLGLASLVLGALRLRRFLRENPKVAETVA